MFDISPVNESHWFNIHKNKAYSSLEDSKDGVMDILISLSKEDPEKVRMKTEFNDVMHFSTLIPFLLEFDNREDKARCAYYQSVIMINKFVNKYLRREDESLLV